MKSLVNSGLLVVAEACVDLRADLARDDLQDLAAEKGEEVVKGSIGLLVNVFCVALAVFDGLVNQLGIFLLLCGDQDKTWVGGGICRAVSLLLDT